MPSVSRLDAEIVKAASKREQCHARMSNAEREQSQDRDSGINYTNYHEFTRIMLFNWKRWRIVRTDSRIYPWKIEERYTLFFFLYWWNTPAFAPPHRFEKMDDAVNKIIEEVGDRANIEYRTDIIKTD